jgi:hypothetical protein
MFLLDQQDLGINDMIFHDFRQFSSIKLAIFLYIPQCNHPNFANISSMYFGPNANLFTKIFSNI